MATLAIVPDPEQDMAEEHMRERILREALYKLDQAEREARHARTVIDTHGRPFIASRYPEQKEFLRPSIVRLRREFGV